MLGYFQRLFPELSTIVVDRKAELGRKNRALLVAFHQGAVRAPSWLSATKEAAIDFRQKSRSSRTRAAGWEYYTANRILAPQRGNQS